MEERSHFLKLAGFVPESKRTEFEQTFRFVFAQLPQECIERNLTVDSAVSGYYHFYSLWPSARSLGEFLKSREFRIIEGAYETLGTLNNSIMGQLVDLKVFKL